ncbi:MAG: HNH endonuclease [Armatimonadota bacterium]|nr:HNH endonuclease [bacterium]
MSQEVLVLNSDYEPLNICNMRRAIALVFLGKVDVLHEDGHSFHTVSSIYTAPSVVRLRNHVRRPTPQLKLSRRSVLARDNHTCQYCGYRGTDLTVDHVIPKRLGGKNTWDNLVACCKKCNSKKSDKTLAQFGHPLLHTPRKPKYVPFISFTKFVNGSRNLIWRDYLPVFQETNPEFVTAERESMANAAG